MIGDRQSCGGSDATDPIPEKLGSWQDSGAVRRATILEALLDYNCAWAIIEEQGNVVAVDGGQVDLASSMPSSTPLRAWLPPTRPSNLGDRAFLDDHGVALPYVAGAMANGIASVELVGALSRAGILSFFGAAGLTIAEVSRAIDTLEMEIGDGPHGFNLIHSPNEPRHEKELVDLYLDRGVRKIEASAYLDITPWLVKYRASGLHRDGEGRIVAPHRVMAKVSRLEVARRFLSPAPVEILDTLEREGQISHQEAQLARSIPLCDDLTAEADSAGHTDNRPALTLLPALARLRDQLAAGHPGKRPIALGAAGGISTPSSAAAAFALGADYILLGSVHQACVESGSSDAVRNLLAQADPADVVMAPAADMFEMGVKVQVLRRGTLFAPRAQRLYEMYRSHSSIDELPDPFRQQLEKDYFRAPIEHIWEETRSYFEIHDVAQVERAMTDPKHRLALLFRWYLGQSSKWANEGDESRTVDYQVWCSPAMGAFNEWVRGSRFENPRERRVVDVAKAILNGATLVTRSRMLSNQGIPIDGEALATALCPDSLLATSPGTEPMRTGR